MLRPRLGLRPGRRPAGLAALALGIAALALGTPVAPAADGGRGGLDVVVDGGATTFVSAPQLAGIRDVGYTEYTTGPGETDTRSGASAAALSDLVGAPRDHVESFVVRLDDQVVRLTGEQVVAGSSADPEGSPRYAVFQNQADDATGPVLFSSPTFSPNGSATELRAALGETLQVEITTYQGTVPVEIDGLPARADVGAAVTPTVRVTDGRTTVASVRWDFGDGTTSTDAAPTHAFAKDGTYAVRASVTARDGRSGVASGSVTVGAAARPPSSDAGTPTPSGTGGAGGGGAGSGGSGAPSSGPSSSDGATAGGSADAPATGGAAGGTSSGAPGRGTRAATDGASTAAPTSSAPRSSTAAPDPATSPSTRSASSGTGATPSRRPDRSRPRRGAADLDGPGTISGVLVGARSASVTTLPGGSTLAAALRRGGSPRPTADLSWVVGVAAVVLLLGLGAARELRPRRPTPTPTRMSAP